MIFKKKKYYFCVALVLFLIVSIIVSSIIFVPVLNKNNIIQAEGSNSFEEGEQDNSVIEGEDNFCETNEQLPESTEKVNILNMTFSNAWAAFNYANKKNNELKSYVVFNQKDHAVAKILGVPVDVNASVNRKVYNNLDEVYVSTDVNTKFDVGNLGIDVSMYESFDAVTLFDNKNNKVVDSSGWETTVTEYVSASGITIYQIPYDISRDTATVVGGLVNNPKSSYYEMTMNLKPKAWEKYLKALKNVIQIEDYPEIQSVTVKVKIDKKYGTFHSIEAVEKFTFNYNYSGMTFKLEAVGQISMKFNYLVDISKSVEKLNGVIYP